MARRPVQGRIKEDIISSLELGEDIPILIYTPPNYTPLQSYSVLICQDGNDYFQLGRIPRQVEELIEEGELVETIVIGVPYPNVAERRKRYHPDGEKTESYIRFLAHELLPYIDGNYSTHQVAHSRVLAGDSLAGTVSLLATLAYPHVFGKVMMHSPLVNTTVLNAVEACQSASDIEIYHVIGTEETAVKTTDNQIIDFVQPNRELQQLLNNMSFTYTYFEFEGNHTWTYWQKDLPRGLVTLLPND